MGDSGERVESKVVEVSLSVITVPQQHVFFKVKNTCNLNMFQTCLASKVNMFLNI